jgi:hypothetical protein
MQQTTREVIARRREDTGRILATVQTIGNTLERLINSGLGSDFSPVSKVADKGLEARIESFVGDWQRQIGAACPFHELYRHLNRDTPGLTIGAFHDLLRKLHHGGMIRLVVWSAPPDRMPEPGLGLFVSSTLMYYATATDRSH